MLYGLAMGTSVHFIKPSKRHLWPTKWVTLSDSLTIQVGGSANSGILSSGSNTLLVDVNSGVASNELKDKLQGKKIAKVLITSLQGDCYGGVEFISTSEIVLPQEDKNLKDFLSQSNNTKIEIVKNDFNFKWEDEEIFIHKISSTYTQSEIVVYLKNHNVVFMGPLFYNKIHPLLKIKEGLSVVGWINAIKKITTLYPTATYIPKEGSLGKLEDIKIFEQYLIDLSNPEVEFSHCRENYDWIEIPQITSLEENFDLIRSNVKNYVTI